MQIKFSHSYPKLHSQARAKLLAVQKCDLSKLSSKFLEYDTVHDGGHYYFAPGVYMILVFLGNDFIPFTTVRRFTEEKFRYYHGSIGNIFDIVVDAKK